MTHSRATNSFGYHALRLALALTLVVTSGRIIQLACVPPDEAAAVQSDRVSNGSSGNQPDAARADAELGELYAMCPMAAVVDLQTVATSPEQVDALLPPHDRRLPAPWEDFPLAEREDYTLPPHRPTGDRVLQRPIEPAVPRIRYPMAIRPSTAAPPAESDVVRIAQGPATARPAEVNSGDGVAPAAEPSPSPSLIGRGNGGEGEWLVEPNEWFIGEEAQQRAAPIVEPPAADESAVPAPDASPPTTDPLLLPSNDAGTPALTQPFEAPPQLPTAAPPSGEPPAPPALRSRGERPPPPSGSHADPPNVGGVSDADSGKLFHPPPAAGATSAMPASQRPVTEQGVDPHLELFAKNAYPSARECAQCHEDIYHEWSVSAHAYAAVSPMFHKFEQKLNDLSQGTVGYFCLRCHAPLATALCASRDEPLWNLPEVAREGITCIACHRVQYVYGKSNGERRIEPGNVFAPVFGGIGGEGVAETIHRKDHFKVKTSPDEPGPGQNLHAAGIYFEPLTRSEFCTPCHQVAVHPGIKLEVVWEQYRASPACKKGIQCQDCHMGKVPGLPLGYNVGPVAKIADKTVNDHRKKSNHIFYGPNYSIAHPGVFPFHLKANRWTMDQWLTFDWRAGWGTEEFENRVADGKISVHFPPVWAELDDRYDAREIIEENLKKLNHKRDIRIEVMENGSHVEGPYFDSPLLRGRDIHFHYVVTNTNEGHNLLTASLGAQPQLWANIALVGPDGRRLWETGYLDSFGDLANIHSEDVRHKRLPYDRQLFNLQTMFLITGAKGTDREFFVPVNLDIDQLPFIRPGVQPISVINHPPFIRMESQSLAPCGSRRAKYRIPGECVQLPGTYRLAFRMRSRAEPIYFMRFCEATPDMVRSMNEWMIDVHPTTVEFTVR